MREKGCFFLGKGENVNILDKSTRLVYVMLSPQPPFIIHKPTSSRKPPFQECRQFVVVHNFLGGEKN